MISYYYIIVSIAFMIGSASIIGFSLFIDEEPMTSIWLFIILILLCVVCFFSAIIYLKKLKSGRYILVFFSLSQILISIRDIIQTHRVMNRIHFVNILLFLFGIICLQHLLSRHSKNWVKKGEEGRS
jgi:hypothetical protein